MLGPLEAVNDGRPIPLPAAKPRALLGTLLLSSNRVVSVARLIDDLWGEEPPETATKALQGYVSQLRKALGADRLQTQAPGYSLRVEDGELDLDRFERQVGEGRELLAAGDAKNAAKRLDEALALWGGHPSRSLRPSRSPARPGRGSRRRDSPPWKIGSTPTSLSAARTGWSRSSKSSLHASRSGSVLEVS